VQSKITNKERARDALEHMNMPPVYDEYLTSDSRSKGIFEEILKIEIDPNLKEGEWYLKQSKI
jgi:hypothetical protein